MNKQTIVGIISAAGIAAALITPAVASASVQHPQDTRSYLAAQATTKITNDPDSGDNGYWAVDNFRNTSSLWYDGKVSGVNCGLAAAAKCYAFEYGVKDTGTTTTVPSADAPAGSTTAWPGLSPRTGATMQEQITGAFNGGSSDGTIYSTSSTPQAWRVLATFNEQGNVQSGEDTIDTWAEQFFPAGDVTLPGGSDLGPVAGWTYTFGFGSDTACPNDGYQWTDAAPDWGSGVTDGDVLAANATDCTP
jgi:hypothetical protein